MAHRNTGAKVKIELPLGDVVDRASILEIKRSKVTDPVKLGQVIKELSALIDAWEEKCSPMVSLPQWDELCGVNRELWEVEDALRACETRQDFGESFVLLARSVYRLNDRRAALKRDINGALHSSLVEVKWYDNPTSSRER
ncbi:MAG: hypothetical protein HN348_17175 [Proteobacteria bacterium]|nr:hypothetical protein [Pseudomonadota bacterium]